MTTTQKLIEDIVREAHMEWLEKAEQADISNGRMTVLPYGFLSPAVRKSVQKFLANILEAEIERWGDKLVIYSRAKNYDKFDVAWDEIKYLQSLLVLLK